MLKCRFEFSILGVLPESNRRPQDRQSCALTNKASFTSSHDTYPHIRKQIQTLIYIYLCIHGHTHVYTCTYIQTHKCVDDPATFPTRLQRPATHCMYYHFKRDVACSISWSKVPRGSVLQCCVAVWYSGLICLHAGNTFCHTASKIRCSVLQGVDLSVCVKQCLSYSTHNTLHHTATHCNTCNKPTPPHLQRYSALPLPLRALLSRTCTCVCMCECV